MKTYTVQAGDSLSKISEKFYGNWSGVDALAKANGITNVNLIMPGQTLQIPDRSGSANSNAVVVEDAQVISDGSGNKKWLWLLLLAAGAGGAYYYHKKKKGSKAKSKPALAGTKKRKKRKK